MRLYFIIFFCFINFVQLPSEAGIDTSTKSPFFAAFSLPWFVKSREANPKDSPWIILYSKEVERSYLAPYNPLVFDAKEHPPLAPLHRKYKVIYGRLDITNFPTTTNQTPELFSSWIDTVFKKEIPSMLQKGFDGIYLDGIENLREGEGHSATLAKDLSQFVLLIKVYFPDVPILIGEGFSLLRDIGYAIQGVIGWIQVSNAPISFLNSFLGHSQSKTFRGLSFN